MSLKLEPRQERFCQEYVATLKPRVAAVRAGYAPRHADVAGRSLLKRWHIEQRIAELMAARAVRTQITADRTVHEIAKVAYVDVADPTVKTGDKVAALRLLGQHQGLFVERVEHTGANGAPLLPDLTPREAARRIAFALTLGLTQKPEQAVPADQEQPA